MRPDLALRASSNFQLPSTASQAQLNRTGDVISGSPPSSVEPEGVEEGEAEDPLPTAKGETVISGQAPESKEDKGDKSEKDQVENIMPQLLPEETMDLTTPKKRQQAEEDEAEQMTKKIMIPTEVPSFNINQVALNSLVEAIQGLREEVARSVKTSERVEKALTENITIMSKVADVMMSLKNAVESSDKEERKRENRRLEANRRREEERRREREEDRKREDRRRELERKEKEERKSEQDRKERELRKQGEDKRSKADGKKECREKENEPRVKSVLGRSYTENTISDGGRKH